MTKDRSSPLFILVAVITAITALYVAKAILLPLALAILLSFLLTPLADRLERWRIPRIPAVLTVVAISFVFLGSLGWVVTNQLVQLSVELPEHKKELLTKIKSLRPNSPTMTKVSDTLTDLRNEITQGAATDSETKSKSDEGTDTAKKGHEPSANSQVSVESHSTPPGSHESTANSDESKNAERRKKNDQAVSVRVVELPPSPFTQIQDWLGPLVPPLTMAGLVVVLVLFLLVDRENQRSRLVQLFGRSHMHATAEAMHDASARVGRYLRTLFLLNAGYGLAVALGLWAIGVPGAIMWGVLGFSLRFLPYIGPWIAAALPIMISIASTAGWTQPMLVLGLYIIIELISNNIVEPLVYGSTTGISTVGVIISAIFWTWLWGPIGLILSMPMTVCLLVAARYVPQLKFITTLLADRPPASPGERVYQRLLAFDDREPTKLAHNFLKESSLAKLYDDVLIPALVMAEQDRHADLLNDDQAEFVLEATEDLIDEVGEADRHKQQTQQAHEAQPEAAAGGEVVSGPVSEPARVLCIPLRDEADELVARMLSHLLTAEGLQAEVGAAESLTGEVVDRVAASDSDVVVISVLPPIAPRDSRLLWKRLRSRYPNLPIVVGFWTAVNDKDALAEPVEDSASRVVTTMAEAVAVVRGMAAQVQLAAKTA